MMRTMTGAELKTIRESLNLSAKEFAGRLKIRSDRTIRHWEQVGEGRPIPDGVAEAVHAWDKAVEDAVSRGLEEHKDARTVTLYRQEHGEFLGDSLPHSRRLLHACIARLRQRLEARGTKVTIEYVIMPGEPEE